MNQSFPSFNCAFLRQGRREAILIIADNPRLLEGLVDVRVLVIKDEDGPEAGLVVAAAVLLAAFSLASTTTTTTATTTTAALEISHGVPEAPRKGLGRQEHNVPALECSFVGTLFPPLHVATANSARPVGPLQHQTTEVLADNPEGDHVLVGIEAGDDGVDGGRSL